MTALWPAVRVSMQASIIIAAHNEGQLLWKTVHSCLESMSGESQEVLVVDDASTDGSIEELRRRFPSVRVVANRERRGGPATKDFGARQARGEVLVMLDAHCNPGPHAIDRLISDVKELDGQAVVTPRVPSLDCEKWENSRIDVGFGFQIELEDFEAQRCISWREMQSDGRFFESPALIGCCMAITSELYNKLWGFDRHMLEWGIEDLDLGLKAWLMGYKILNDPQVAIGHRFQPSFENFSVAEESPLVNQMRMARKNFTDAVWSEWVDGFRSRQPRAVWDSVWKLYSRGKESVEREREYLFRHRVRDEFIYAEHFGLKWPQRPEGSTQQCS